MIKKVAAAIIISAMTASVIPVSAYDENGAMQYLENCARKYSTVKELEEDSTDILTQLQDNYECESSEAEELYNSLAEKIKEKESKEDNTGDAENGNKTDDVKNDGNNGGKTDEKVLKKNTQIKTDILSQLGVFDGDGINYFANVTRGEFAVYTAKLVNYGGDFSKEKGYYSFKDVTSENDCYRAVASLINKEAVTGLGEGIYAPDSDITLSQAASILMRILGYEAPEGSEVNNETYFYGKAVKYNITKGITIGENDCISYEDAVILLYNMLDAKCVNCFGSDKYSFGKGFMEEYLNLETAQGVVTSNSVTSLYSPDGAVSKGYLDIDENLYNFVDLKTVTELDSLLGKRVSVYYDIDEPDMGKAVAALDDYNEYLNIRAEDIENYNTAENRLYYSDDGKVRHIDIPMAAKLIFNGSAVDYAHDKKLMFEPDSGEITFLKNSKGSEWNVIFIDSYVYYESAKINTSNPVLYDNLKLQPDIKLDDAVVTAFKDGEIIEASAIPTGSIIMAAPSRVVCKDGIMYPDTENAAHIRLEIIGNEVSGKVSGIGTDNITIDGEKYTLSKTLQKLNKAGTDNKSFKIPLSGSTVTAELDKYSAVISFTVGSYNDGVQYGYIVRLTHDEDNDKYNVKLFTQDGQMVQAVLKDKVKVHKKWNDGPLNESTYYAKKITADKVAVIDAGKFNPQAVKYSISGTNEINEIYLADTTYTKTSAEDVGKDLDFYVGDKDIFEKDFSNVNGTGANYWNLIYWYRVSEGNNNGTYFVIPTDSSATDDEYKAYKTTITNLPNGYWSNMEFYDVDQTGGVGLVIRYVAKGGKTGKLENATTVVVAEEPEAVYDEKRDEITYSIKLYANKKKSRIWTQGEFQTYTFADPETVSYTVSSENFKKLSNVPITSLKPGDLLRISTDSESGKISGFCVLATDVGEIDPNTGKPEVGCLYPEISVSNTTIKNDTAFSVWQTTHVTKAFVEKCVGASTFYVNDGSRYYRKLTIGDNTYSRDKVVIYDKSARKNPVTEATPSDIRVGDYVISAFDETLIIVRNYD